MNLWFWNYIPDLIQIKPDDGFPALVVPILSTLNALACRNMLLFLSDFKERGVK